MTTATFAIGNALSNVPIQILGCVMSCLLIVAWFSIFGIMIRAVLMKDILWPQKQEDREEGGWKTNPNEKSACDLSICEPKRRSLSIISRRRTGQTQDDREGMEPTGYNAPSEPIEAEEGARNNLPAIAERLVDDSARGRGETWDDDIV